MKNNEKKQWVNIHKQKHGYIYVKKMKKNIGIYTLKKFKKVNR